MSRYKKPKIINEYGVTYNVCPECEAIVSYYYDPETHETVYPNECPGCGQKLIWDVKEGYYMNKMIKETMRKLRNKKLEEL